MTVAAEWVADIGAELATKATISGRVIGSDGQPLADVSVYASDVSISPGGWFCHPDVDGPRRPTGGSR